MKTDLDLVIHELRKERKNLERLIKDCIEDTDFLGAHTYQEALYLVQRELRIFIQIKNPNVEKIRDKAHYIKRSKKHLKDLSAEFKNNSYLNVLEDKLTEEENELKELRSEKIEYGLDDLLFPDLLNDLLTRKIKRIKLEIYKNEKVILGLRLIKSDLIIELSGIQKKSKLNYHNKQFIKLKQIGFVFHGIKMEKVVKDFNEQKILNVIEILSRIVYDAFSIFLYELDNPMNLIIEA